MNETSTSSFFVALLFVFRCLVPLTILFGISYLLRRMGLVVIERPEPSEAALEAPTAGSTKPASSPKLTSQTQIKKPQKRKVSPPRKKDVPSRKTPVGKTKTGTSRSRSE